jgi:hypothetical protein
MKGCAWLLANRAAALRMSNGDYDGLSNKLRNTRNVETTVQSEIWKCPGGVQ